MISVPGSTAVLWVLQGSGRGPQPSSLLHPHSLSGWPHLQSLHQHPGDVKIYVPMLTSLSTSSWYSQFNFIQRRNLKYKQQIKKAPAQPQKPRRCVRQNSSGVTHLSALYGCAFYNLSTQGKTWRILQEFHTQWSVNFAWALLLLSM